MNLELANFINTHIPSNYNCIRSRSNHSSSSNVVFKCPNSLDYAVVLTCEQQTMLLFLRKLFPFGKQVCTVLHKDKGSAIILNDNDSFSLEVVNGLLSAKTLGVSLPPSHKNFSREFDYALKGGIRKTFLEAVFSRSSYELESHLFQHFTYHNRYITLISYTRNDKNRTYTEKDIVQSLVIDTKNADMYWPAQSFLQEQQSAGFDVAVSGYNAMPESFVGLADFDTLSDSNIQHNRAWSFLESSPGKFHGYYNGKLNYSSDAALFYGLLENISGVDERFVSLSKRGEYKQACLRISKKNGYIPLTIPTKLFKVLST